MTDAASPRTTGAVAAGLATVTSDGTVLDTWFPAPELVAASTADLGPAGTERLDDARAAELLGNAVLKATGPDPVREVEVVAVRTVIASSTTSRWTPTTRTCASTCSATGWSSRTGRTWRASSACWPTSPGPRWVRWPSTGWRRCG